MEVQMLLDKVWDASAGRLRVGKGGVWLVEASCVLVEGEERWVLDELPAELTEQAYMSLSWDEKWTWNHLVSITFLSYLYLHITITDRIPVL